MPRHSTAARAAQVRARLAALRARRAERPEFVRASQARIWRITAVAVAAIAGLTVAFLAFLARTGTLNRLDNDEKCLRSVVQANTQRSALLTELGARLAAADQARQDWNTAEQRIFGRALNERTAADRAAVRRDFAKANAGYLAADDRYRRLSRAYTRAVKANPPAQLRCRGPVAPTRATITAAGSTVRATSTATSTATRKVPGPRATSTRTVVRPGATFTTVLVGPVSTRTVVRTVAPRTRTVTATATRTVLPLLPLPKRICRPLHLRLC